jgi:acyl-CoA synthetase (AMP-forming)/AMP-acid ligase II
MGQDFAGVDEFLTRQVAARPGALALRDSIGRDWTWDDLDRAAQAGVQMWRDLGTAPGDRVMILAENCNSAVAMVFAAWRMGAIAVPINARQTAGEVDRIIAHAKPAAITMTSAISEEAAAHAKRLGAQMHMGSYGAVHAIGSHPSNPVPDRRLAVLLYTTGTTGTPKGVMLSHENLRFGGFASAQLRDMSPDDLVYGALPITHVFGLASVVVAATAAGAAVRLEPRFTAAKLCDALAEGVTVLPAVPQMHALLMEHVQRQGLGALGPSALRYVSSGAAPLDPAWKRKAEGFYGLALQNGYGMTETTAGVCATRNPLGVPDISVGRALPGVEVRIDTAAPGASSDIGEVLIRGANVMMGYFENPEDTQKVLDPDGWMRSGDLGQIDADGNLHIVGRSKELIIHSGFNVYPPEVEAALNAHPEVIQSAVIGRAHGGDEEVLAFVQVPQSHEVTQEALSAFVADRLAGYKRPARIILATALPAAPTGKILKHRLLEHFADKL